MTTVQTLERKKQHRRVAASDKLIDRAAKAPRQQVKKLADRIATVPQLSFTTPSGGSKFYMHSGKFQKQLAEAQAAKARKTRRKA